MFDSHLPFQCLSVRRLDDPSTHISTTSFSINPAGHRYIIDAEEYASDLYVLKFYPAQYKRHPKKYQLITGSHVMPVVMGTCLKIFQSFYAVNQLASLGFVATATAMEGIQEAKANNQRFRIYKHTMENHFSKDVFSHFMDPVNSCYLMVNQYKEPDVFAHDMQLMFSELYPEIEGLRFMEVEP